MQSKQHQGMSSSTHRECAFLDLCLHTECPFFCAAFPVYRPETLPRTLSGAMICMGAPVTAAAASNVTSQCLRLWGSRQRLCWRDRNRVCGLLYAFIAVDAPRCPRLHAWPLSAPMCARAVQPAHPPSSLPPSSPLPSGRLPARLHSAPVCVHSDNTMTRHLTRSEMTKLSHRQNGVLNLQISEQW